MIVFIILRLFSIIICAALASNRNRSEMLWAFLGLILGLLPVLVIACLPTIQSNENKQNDISLSNNLDELKKLKELLDSNIITQEEFENLKKQILNL